MNAVVTLLGRLLLVSIFLLSGFGKIGRWEQTAANMEAHGMPFVSVLLLGAIVFLIVGATLVVLGFKARVGAAMLIAFLIPATLIFHGFWNFEGGEAVMQRIQFMKNLAILGGLLTILARGSGEMSIDSN